MSIVSQFPTAAERNKRSFEEWQKDYIERRRAEGTLGDYSSDIFDWQEMLEGMGWNFTMFAKNNQLAEGNMYADFDQKIILLHMHKAKMTHTALNEMIQDMFAGQTGRKLYYWQDILTERYEREDGTFYYAMEFKERVLEHDEMLPTSPDEPAPEFTLGD